MFSHPSHMLRLGSSGIVFPQLCVEEGLCEIYPESAVCGCECCDFWLGTDGSGRKRERSQKEQKEIITYNASLSKEDRVQFLRGFYSYYLLVPPKIEESP